jgi:CubicO group peptidase (beta-lactamase class C family)
MKNKAAVVTTAVLIISLFLSSCIKEGDLTRPFTTFQPADIGDGWLISNPSVENVDSLALIDIYKDLYAHDKAWALKSMLVFRNGKLIAESYLKDDADRTRYNAIWSCTKQVTGIATGIALTEDYIQSLDDSISKYLPDEVALHPDKKNITIANLLTMRSGIYFDNGNETDVFRTHSTESSVDYVLGDELKWEPGTHYQYNDGAPQIVSAIIQKTTGMTLANYTKQKFFSKIGLTRYEWKDYSDGLTLGAFGLMMPPRELAKVAQCVCDNGKWKDEQIIPLEWLDQMLTIRVPNVHNDVGFGYFWWISDERNLCYMHGHGGQYAAIYPLKRIVVVATSLEQIEESDFGFSIDDLLSFSDRINAIAE